MSRIPTAMRPTQSELPPYEMNGSVTPTTGARPTTIATLTTTCQNVIAATPMTPAPKNRTSLRKTVVATCCAVPAISIDAVRMGNRIQDPTAIPARMARPAEMPMRCPAPINAIDRLEDTAVAPPATRK